MAIYSTTSRTANTTWWSQSDGEILLVWRVVRYDASTTGRLDLVIDDFKLFRPDGHGELPRWVRVEKLVGDDEQALFVSESSLFAVRASEMYGVQEQLHLLYVRKTRYCVTCPIWRNTSFCLSGGSWVRATRWFLHNDVFEASKIISSYIIYFYLSRLIKRIEVIYDYVLMR
jgi:hypothetical protein